MPALTSPQPSRVGRLRPALVVLALVAGAFGIAPTPVAAQAQCDDAYTCPGQTGSISLQKFVSTTPGCPEQQSSFEVDPASVVEEIREDGDMVPFLRVHFVNLHICYRMTNDTNVTLQGHEIWEPGANASMPLQVLPGSMTPDPAFFVDPGGSLQHDVPAQFLLRTHLLRTDPPIFTGPCSLPDPPPVDDGAVGFWRSRVDATTVIVDFESNTAGTSADITAACASL